MRKTIGLVLALACATAAFACASNEPTSRLPGGEGGAYVALGDSMAAGSGASDPAATSYVALLGEVLRQRYGEELEVVALGKGGATTQGLIDEQLPAAVERIEQGEVRLVTITIGGNDLDIIQSSPNVATCIEDPLDPACPVTEIVGQVRGNFSAIIEALYAADPEVTIAVLLYPNLFSGTGNILEEPADVSFDTLDVAIAGVAAEYDLITADARPGFSGRGNDLTHLADAAPDPHPNDAGYRVIADAFFAALGLLP